MAVIPASKQVAIKLCLADEYMRQHSVTTDEVPALAALEQVTAQLFNLSAAIALQHVDQDGDKITLVSSRKWCPAADGANEVVQSTDGELSELVQQAARRRGRTLRLWLVEKSALDAFVPQHWRATPSASSSSQQQVQAQAQPVNAIASTSTPSTSMGALTLASPTQSAPGALAPDLPVSTPRRRARPWDANAEDGTPERRRLKREASNELADDEAQAPDASPTPARLFQSSPRASTSRTAATNAQPPAVGTSASASRVVKTEQLTPSPPRRARVKTEDVTPQIRSEEAPRIEGEDVKPRVKPDHDAETQNDENTRVEATTSSHDATQSTHDPFSTQDTATTLDSDDELADMDSVSDSEPPCGVRELPSDAYDEKDKESFRLFTREKMKASAGREPFLSLNQLRKIRLEPMQAKNTTKHVLEVNPGTRYGLYLRAEVAISAKVDGISTALPCLKLADVRILHQRFSTAAYGSAYVNMAIPAKHVWALRHKLASKVPWDKEPIMDGKFTVIDGVRWAVFKCYLPPESTHRGMFMCAVDRPAGARVPLWRVLDKGNADVMAFVEFEVSLRHRGPAREPEDEHAAPMSLSFKPLEIRPYGYAFSSVHEAANRSPTKRVMA